MYDRSFIKSLGNFDWIFRSISFMGLGGTQFIILFLIWLLGVKGSSLKPETAWKLKNTGHAGILALIASGVFSQVLKHIIGRPRPRFDNIWEIAGPTLEKGFNSFPSGHTSTSFAIAAVASCYFPGLRWIFFGGAGLIGLSRVFGGSHYPSDIAGGIILGLITGRLIGTWFNNKRDKRSGIEKR